MVWDFGKIFYKRTVVGDNTFSTNTKMGGRTSLFLSSQRMPSRYGCVHEHLQLYKGKNYIYVNLIIHVYIRTLRWLYVVITTKVKYGLQCVHMLVQLVNSQSQKIFVFCIFGIYFMNTPLTVCCYNNESQRWWYNAYMNIYNCINRIFL